MVEWKQSIPCSFYRYLVKHMTVQFTHKPANRYITFLNSKVQSINERKFPKAEVYCNATFDTSYYGAESNLNQLQRQSYKSSNC